MRLLILISFLLIAAASNAQQNAPSLLPMRITVITSAGVKKEITGYGVMQYDTAMNRLHNNPISDSLPHFVQPVAFLNARKKTIKGSVVLFSYIIK